jgi:sporulation protein YlmC with PRC-barrel domain
MISNENLGGLMGAPVIGADDERIGTVGQVFVDPTTGAPNWVTVHTGWFGRHETFVPLDEASWDREELRVPYDKSLVKDAPRIDTDEALSPEAEGELYGYYGIGGGPAEDSGDRREETDAAAPTGESMRLRKYQVTEEKDVTVPVTHEEVRLEPESSTGADAAAADQPRDAEPASNEPVNSGPANNSKHKGRHRA